MIRLGHQSYLGIREFKGPAMSRSCSDGRIRKGWGAMRSWIEWSASIGLAAACVMFTGCGGSDVPDPGSDPAAASDSAPERAASPAPERVEPAPAPATLPAGPGVDRTVARRPQPPSKKPIPAPRRSKTRPRRRMAGLPPQNRKAAHRRPRCWRWRPVVSRARPARNLPAEEPRTRASPLRVLVAVPHRPGKAGLQDSRARCDEVAQGSLVDHLNNLPDLLTGRRRRTRDRQVGRRTTRWERMPKRCGSGPRPRQVRAAVLVAPWDLAAPTVLVARVAQVVAACPASAALKGREGWDSKIMVQPIRERLKAPFAPS